jgi:hypothetical protein
MLSEEKKLAGMQGMQGIKAKKSLCKSLAFTLSCSYPLHPLHPCYFSSPGSEKRLTTASADRKPSTAAETIPPA